MMIFGRRTAFTTSGCFTFCLQPCGDHKLAFSAKDQKCAKENNMFVSGRINPDSKWWPHFFFAKAAASISHNAFHVKTSELQNKTGISMLPPHAKLAENCFLFSFSFLINGSHVMEV